MSDWWSYRPEDFLLFSPRTYWRLFELHNAALWPLHLLTLLAGAAIFLLVFWRPSGHGRWIALLLALTCISVGWLFLWNRYATINWAILYVAPLFALQAVALLIIGTGFGGLAFDRRGIAGWTGLFLATLGVAAYPFLSPLLGRPWDEVEVFGIAPDPTMIAMLGFLLAAQGRLPVLLFPIPLLWLSLSGMTLGTMGDPQAWLPLLSVGLTMAVILLHATVGRSGAGKTDSLHPGVRR
jgi:hypothetical protein